MTGKAGGQIDVALAAAGLDRLYLPREAAGAVRGEGGRHHRQSGDHEHELSDVVGQQACGKAETDDDEGEFATLAEQQGDSELDRRVACQSGAQAHRRSSF